MSDALKVILVVCVFVGLARLALQGGRGALLILAAAALGVIVAIGSYLLGRGS